MPLCSLCRPLEVRLEFRFALNAETPDPKKSTAAITLTIGVPIVAERIEIGTGLAYEIGGGEIELIQFRSAKDYTGGLPRRCLNPPFLCAIGVEARAAAALDAEPENPIIPPAVPPREES